MKRRTKSLVLTDLPKEAEVTENMNNPSTGRYENQNDEIYTFQITSQRERGGRGA
jgi:hypothetical protein